MNGCADFRHGAVAGRTAGSAPGALDAAMRGRRTALFLFAAAAVTFGASNASTRLAREDFARLFRGTVTSADADGGVGLRYDFSTTSHYEDFENVPRGAAGKLQLSLWKRPVWLKAQFEGSLSLELDVATDGAPGAIYVLVDPELEEGYVFLFGLDIGPNRTLTAVGKSRKGKLPETIYVGQRGSWNPGTYAISLSRDGEELEMAIDGRIVIKTRDKTYTSGRIGFSGDLTIRRLDVRGRLAMPWCVKALSAAPEVGSTDDIFGLVGVRPGFRLPRELPAWAVTFEHKTRHYVVMSNASRHFTDSCARSAEAMRALFASAFPPPAPEDREASRIVIFNTREEFTAFGAPPASLGFYAPASRTVYLFDHVNPAVTRRVLLHEGFRQYAHLLLTDPPPWLETGMAQYFETAEWDGDDLKAGAPGPRLRSLAKLMKQGASCELPSFMLMRERAFHNPFAAGRNASCAAGFAHFFMHGKGGIYRKNLVAYVAALRAGDDHSTAYDKAFGAISWDELKSQWFDHIADIEAK